MAVPTAVQHITTHILNSLSEKGQRPLFAALQGPQGSGKSFLTGLVQSTLTASPHSLRVAVLSIDDLYLPHDGLRNLAQNHPENPLWRGRGQPGTHDIGLGLKVLQSLQTAKSSVEIPRFEKSLFGGEGDRLPMDGTGTIVETPVDVVLFEGWCNGFYPISQSELDRRWNSIWENEKKALDLDDSIVGGKSSVEEVNDSLKQYLPLWNFFDVFVKVLEVS